MPQALALDREQVRIVAMAVGVREAARQFELPESTVQSWSARGNWFGELDEEKEAQELAINRVRESQELRPAATRTAAEVLRSYDGDTRFHLARGLNKGAKTIGNMDGQEILMAAPLISQVAKSAALVHGWNADSTQTVMNVNLIQSCQDQGPVIDLD